MIISKKLSKFKEISHGFFNRKGGISKGIYKSLNCGIGSNDSKDKVRKNLQIVRKKINKKSKDIFLVNQCHSNKFVFIDRNFKFPQKKINADAIITDQVKLPIAILTADCAPLLLYDYRRNMVAAIHAGWKGALKGIVKKVVNLMLKKGCKRKHLCVAIGPCINQNNYNVREDFKKKFIRSNKKNKIFFKEKKKALFFNLPKFIKYQLKSIKITNIDTIYIDTFIKKNNFFSARQSIKLQHDDYGRNISIIMIN